MANSAHIQASRTSPIWSVCNKTDNALVGWPQGLPRQDMAWANPGIERQLQSWLWRSLSYRRKAQLPSFTGIHHSHHASPCRTWFRSRTKNYHNSVIFTTRMKTTTFLFSLLLFWIVQFFSRNWHFLRWKSKSFSKISTFLLENKILKSYSTCTRAWRINSNWRK